MKIKVYLTYNLFIMGKEKIVMASDPSDKEKSTWDRTVHATFRKVVAFDLLFLGLGIIIGIGIGVFLIKGIP